jgi:uncharacterized protein
MTAEFREGVRLFNSQKFFEAHEALEAIWLKAHGSEKLFLHGLIQVAAAFHHHSRNNPVGFKSLLEKGREKLVKSGEAREGIDLAGFLRQLQPWREWLARGGTTPAVGPPPVPRIETGIAGRTPG